MVPQHLSRFPTFLPVINLTQEQNGVLKESSFKVKL